MNDVDVTTNHRVDAGEETLPPGNDKQTDSTNLHGLLAKKLAMKRFVV
ncbi:MAG: hypothetical protein LBJ75_03375 [Puniceicoccales bacterium]|jgi:hypothetical protein|nr:hypothetical protein [Puniceicoccales bacterium]